MTGPHVSGVVVAGERRGRLLGYPTANLRLADDVEVPRFGVYAALADGRPAAVSVGVRPTFGPDLEPLVEVHILDFDGDLYGQVLSVELVERLRDELTLDSADALREQIAADVAAVRAVTSRDVTYRDGRARRQA